MRETSSNSGESSINEKDNNIENDNEDDNGETLPRESPTSEDNETTQKKKKRNKNSTLKLDLAFLESYVKNNYNWKLIMEG